MATVEQLGRGAAADFDRALPSDRTAVLIAIGVLWFALLSGFIPFMLHHAVDPEAKPYEPVTHLHAALSFGWLALLSWQAGRVRAGDIAGHKRTGRRFGPVMAAAVAVTAVATVWASDRARIALDPQFNYARLSFQLGHVIPFALLTGAGLWLARQPGAHKRLLILAVAAITDTGVSRWVGRDLRSFLGDGPAAELLGRFPFAWGLLAGLAAYDIATRGRLHPLFLPAAALILGTELLSLWLFYAPWWPGVARQLLGG